jgi:hypothetical protein
MSLVYSSSSTPLSLKQQEDKTEDEKSLFDFECVATSYRNDQAYSDPNIETHKIHAILSSSLPPVKIVDVSHTPLSHTLSHQAIITDPQMTSSSNNSNSDNDHSDKKYIQKNCSESPSCDKFSNEWQEVPCKKKIKKEHDNKSPVLCVMCNDHAAQKRTVKEGGGYWKYCKECYLKPGPKCKTRNCTRLCYLRDRKPGKYHFYCEICRKHMRVKKLKFS